jgi:hypothetical protein
MVAPFQRGRCWRRKLPFHPAANAAVALTVLDQPPHQPRQVFPRFGFWLPGLEGDRPDPGQGSIRAGGRVVMEHDGLRRVVDNGKHHTPVVRPDASYHRRLFPNTYSGGLFDRVMFRIKILDQFTHQIQQTSQWMIIPITDDIQQGIHQH